VSLPQAAPFELGPWAIERVVAVVFPPLDTRKSIRLGKNFVDMLGVICPVGGNVERATIDQPVRDEIEECRLDDATLVVPLFWPRIGKIEVQSSE
jgi:hypothetical protein